MAYELVHNGPDGAELRCPDCGMERKIPLGVGPDRAKIWQYLRDIIGCECPIGRGGSAAVIPGAMVYRLSDGNKFQVHDVQPATQQIKCIDTSDCLTGWEDVRKFARWREGTAFRRFLRRLKDGLVE